MHRTAGVSEISKTIQRDLTFILNFLSGSSIHFAQFSVVLAKKNIVSFKQVVFIENDGRMVKLAKAFAAKIQCMIQSSVSITKFSFCGALSKRIFVWDGGISKRLEIVPLLVILHSLCSLYRGMRTCFHSCRYQNQKF